MKTICIKTNNQNSIDYLLKSLDNIDLEGIKISFHKFKIFSNIFIHYNGNKLVLLLTELANILSALIIDEYEPTIEKSIFLRDFFYFDNVEKKEILKRISTETFDSNSYSNRKIILFNIFFEFLNNEHTLYLKGFITFRLQKYKDELSSQIESIINEYIVEKEYDEFVSLLNLYVNSEESKIDCVHLIYKNQEPILLDQNHKPIETDTNLLNAKYLSDITFSSADVVFNTLLNIIPKKIYIHLNNRDEDEFINTLELVFENRVYLIRG